MNSNFPYMVDCWADLVLRLLPRPNSPIDLESFRPDSLFVVFTDFLLEGAPKYTLLN